METTVSNKLDQFIADLKASPIAMPMALQEAAQGYLLGQDFPTTKAERFKYTRLGKLAAAAFDSAIQLDQTQLKEHCVCSDAYTIFEQRANYSAAKFTSGLRNQLAYRGQYGVPRG